MTDSFSSSFGVCNIRSLKQDGPVQVGAAVRALCFTLIIKFFKNEFLMKEEEASGTEILLRS